MSAMGERDRAIFSRALPYLDVRSNDEHTAYAYFIARALLKWHPQAREDIVLPAMLLHDVGWKTVPENQILFAIGPGAKFPELVRQHEVEGARIARELLGQAGLSELPADAIAAIIDGHDTRKFAISLEDSLVKDADKLWRFTPHGFARIQNWFGYSQAEAAAMLRSFVVPTLLTDTGHRMADAYLASIDTDLALDALMGR